MTNVSNIAYVTKYLITYDKNNDNFKNINKILKKKYKFYKSNIELINYKKSFNDDIFKIMVTFLKQMLKDNTNSNSNKKCYGILTDNNKIISDITLLPETPNEWDILFLQYNLKEYNYLNKDNNVYWTNGKINDSKHFVINHNSIIKVVDVIKESKNWNDFIESINYKLNCFVLNNSSPSKSICINSNKKLINDKIYFDNFTKIFNNLSEEEKYKSLPNVSLISIVTDNNLFFHTIYTFLKLNYPRDKLELVIVVDDSIKFNDKNLPKDERIKIINATNKNNKDSEIPLGYKINAGIKYSKYSLICHLFDTNCYNTNYLYNFVRSLIVSKGDCIISYDTGIYNTKTNMSYFNQSCDLRNMIYRKEFWKSYNFNVFINDEEKLIDEFTYFRQDCIHYVPFINYSFKLIENDSNGKNNKLDLQFSLRNLVDIKLEDSFIETFE